MPHQQEQQQQPQPPQAAVFAQGQEPLTASMLAEAPPSEQKQMLGDRLFPLIKGLFPDMAGKITGMLHIIDNFELLHLLEHKESSSSKDEEAVAVLQPQQPQPPQAAVFVQSQEPLTASMLAQVPPSEQKQILGKHLFALIKGLFPDMAGKITGMLLEIDNSELVHMLEHKESLSSKVRKYFNFLMDILFTITPS